MDVSTMDNRRSEIRKEIRIPSIIEKNGVQTKVVLVDLSEHGLGFISSNDLKEGEIIQITISQDGSKVINPISIEVEIKNRRHHAEMNRFGAIITSIQEGYQSIINKLFYPSGKSNFAARMQTIRA